MQKQIFDEIRFNTISKCVPSLSKFNSLSVIIKNIIKDAHIVEPNKVAIKQGDNFVQAKYAKNKLYIKANSKYSNIRLSLTNTSIEGYFEIKDHNYPEIENFKVSKQDDLYVLNFTHDIYSNQSATITLNNTLNEADIVDKCYVYRNCISEISSVCQSLANEKHIV